MKKAIQYAAILLTAAVATPTLFAQRPLGIDVSSYQGSINWASVYSDGVKFAFAKATEGYAYFQDPDFKANMKNGKAAGELMGAYHYAHTYADTPAQEAGYFWGFAGSYIIADGKTLMPVVDVEDFQGVVGATTYTAWVNDWGKDIVNDGAAAGVTLSPILATTPCDLCAFFNSNLTLDLWLSNDNGESSQTGSPWGGTSCNCFGQAWTFWGFGTGAITGISGSVDLDTYHGTFSQLKTNEVVK